MLLRRTSIFTGSIFDTAPSRDAGRAEP
jgi:hypothetical protein